MTAVIGFVTKEQIVVAADSQVTTGDFKQTDATKVFELKFKGGKRALLARAGVIDGADFAQEMIEASAKNTEVTDEQTIRRTVENAIKEAKNKILESVRHSALRPEDCVAHLESLQHEMLLAYYHGGKPFLYKSNFVGGYLVPPKGDYIAIGSGEPIATFVLEGIDTKTLNETEGFGLAAYTIGFCKRGSNGVSGRTHLGVIWKNGKSAIIAGSFRDTLESVADGLYDEMREEMLGRIQTELNQRVEARMNVIRDFIRAKEAGLASRSRLRKPRK